MLNIWRCTVNFLILFVVFTSLYMGMLWKTGIVDYSEGVSAEVSREMLVKHHYILPTLNGQDFLEKPPLLYWGQMLGYRLFHGATAFGARFINALAGIATVLLLFLAGRKPLGVDTAFKAAFILGTGLLFVYLSRVAMADMLLTFFFLLCLCFLWWGIERALEQKNGAPLFWLGCASAGLAMLTDGAVGALFPLVTVFCYLLSIGRLRLLFKRSWIIPGAIILVSVGLSWYLLLGFSHAQGFSSIRELLVTRPMEQFKTPLQGHSGPISFYFVVLLAGFLPWSAFVPFAAVRCPYLDSSSQRVRFLRLFLLFSIIIFAFFSAAATKLPDSICPALPGIALLTAVLFDEKEKRGRLAWSISTYSAALLILCLGTLLLASPQIVAHLPQRLGDSALKAPVLAQAVHLGFLPYAAGLILTAAGLGLIVVNRTTTTTSLFTALSATALVVAAVFFLLVLPAYDGLIDRPLAHLAEQAADRTPEDGRIVMLDVWSHPSVNFYSHRTTIDAHVNAIDALKRDFQDPKVTVGITTEYYFGKLRDAGVTAQSLETDHGYVLFDLPADHP